MFEKTNTVRCAQHVCPVHTSLPENRNQTIILCQSVYLISKDIYGAMNFLHLDLFIFLLFCLNKAKTISRDFGQYSYFFSSNQHQVFTIQDLFFVVAIQQCEMLQAWQEFTKGHARKNMQNHKNFEKVQLQIGQLAIYEISFATRKIHVSTKIVAFDLMR